MKLSIIIPAKNERTTLRKTVADLIETLEKHQLSDFEVIVINDHSDAEYQSFFDQALNLDIRVRVLFNRGEPGFGNAIHYGLNHFQGDAVAIMMADGSDLAEDLVRYVENLTEGVDCVFGSRFMKESSVTNYPLLKLLLNRVANTFIRMLFWTNCNDTTNAFKLYRRETIEGIRPILSKHFNITVELPLKAIARGFKHKVIPISWRGREEGVSKFKIKEAGSRYCFIILYVWLEKALSRGDYQVK